MSLSRKCCTIRLRAPGYTGSFQFDTKAQGGQVGIALAARGEDGSVILAQALTPKAAEKMAAEFSRMSARLRNAALTAKTQKRGVFGRLLWWRR